MEGEGRVENAEQVVAASFPAYCRENAGENGWTQHDPEAVGWSDGVHQQYVSKVLKGQENLYLETMSKIEDCLHISILQEELEMA